MQIAAMARLEIQERAPTLSAGTPLEVTPLPSNRADNPVWAAVAEIAALGPLAVNGASHWVMSHSTILRMS
jgi:hypothetical protein